MLLTSKTIRALGGVLGALCAFPLFAVGHMCIKPSSSRAQTPLVFHGRFTATALVQDALPSVLEEGQRFDFIPDSGILNKGNAQFYGRLLSLRELRSSEHQALYQFLQAMNFENVLHAPGDDISFLKLAYLIPHVSPHQMTREITNSKAYIESTLVGTQYIAPNEFNLKALAPQMYSPWMSKQAKLLVTKKNIGMGIGPKTVFEISQCSDTACDVSASVCKDMSGLPYHFGLPAKVSYSKLLYSTYETLSDSVSFTQYYPLVDGSGTLVLSYTLAKLHFGLLARAQRSVAKNANAKEFPEETARVILANRQYFKLSH